MLFHYYILTYRKTNIINRSTFIYIYLPVDIMSYDRRHQAVQTLNKVTDLLIFENFNFNAVLLS